MKIPKGLEKVLATKTVVTCSVCKEPVHVLDLGSEKRCRSCERKRVRKIWTDNKKRAVEHLGGKCIDCGIDGPLVVFDFHHLDPQTKEFVWTDIRSCKWETILKEIMKCALLCSNCHRIRHWVESGLDDDTWTCE